MQVGHPMHVPHPSGSLPESFTVAKLIEQGQ
jgi:hypothetical protein